MNLDEQLNAASMFVSEASDFDAYLRELDRYLDHDCICIYALETLSTGALRLNEVRYINEFCDVLNDGLIHHEYDENVKIYERKPQLVTITKSTRS